MALTGSDYSSGTWTPTILGSSTAGTQTYNGSATIGWWARNGNLITIGGIVTLTALDPASAGSTWIGGLPFTSMATHNSPIALAEVSNVTHGTDYFQYGARVRAAATTIALIEFGKAAAAASNPVNIATQLSATTIINFGGSYRIL